jgi:Protein of unknown function (DUF2442)
MKMSSKIVGTNILGNSSPKATKVWFDQSNIYVNLTDGYIASMPLHWFPHLLNATIEQRQSYELWDDGKWIHWESIDEDLSVEGFLTFQK